MFTIRRALVAIATLGLGLIATSSPAAASYVPGDPIDLNLVVSSCTVGGNALHIRATATSGGQPVAGTITVKALDRTFTDNDSDIRVATKTPLVTQRTTFKVTADFVPTEASFTQPPTETRNATVVPRSVGCSPGSNGVLPDTGGLSLWYVILGGLLLVIGAGVLLISARKRSNTSS